MGLVHDLFGTPRRRKKKKGRRSPHWIAAYRVEGRKEQMLLSAHSRKHAKEKVYARYPHAKNLRIKRVHGKLRWF